MNYNSLIFGILFFGSILFLSESIAAYTIEGNGTCNCNGCIDCSNALNNNTNCSVLVKLTDDIIDHSGTCINDPVNFNNKIFDCQGHRIDGDNSGTDYGIYLYYKLNNTIRNCIITQFYYGVYVYGWYHIIANNTINSNTESGIYVYSSSNNLLANNTANSNVYGIYLISSPNNILEENTLKLNTEYGIFLYSSAYNSLSRNTANSNTLCGIHLLTSTYCTITNNTATSNKYGLYLTYQSSYNNMLYNNLSANTNTGFVTSYIDPKGVSYGIGNTGNSLRKNEISNNGNGIYSLGATSTMDWNIVCGNTNLDFNSTTWLSSSGDNNTCNKPGIWNDTLTTGCTYSCTTETDYVCNCSSCSDCGERLSDLKCREIRLSADITNHAGTCINNPVNFNNKTFECQGHKIDGDDSGTDYGIHLSQKNNNTIKNCVITDFYHGIFLNSSSNITLSNINTSSHTQYGTYLYQSTNNTLTNVTANSNSQNGIYMRSSSQNTLTNITANSNSQHGVYLYNSANNLLSQITANSNSQNGIYFYNSSYNSLLNSTLNLNNYGLYLLYYSNFNNISNNKLSNNTQNGITTSDCDPSLWCPGGNTNNTFYGNEISSNNIGIYSKSSSSTINLNLVCDNVDSDFSSTDWQSSSGDDNTCNRPDGWNDDGAIGCTSSCLCYCSSCSGCQEKLNDSSCNAVYLSSSIVNQTSTCINNPKNFNNKTFDCQGYAIDGKNVTSTYGIYLNGTYGNTIKNCIITEFYHGLFLNSSLNSTLSNINTSSHAQYGIYLYQSTGNTLRDIIASYSQNGIYLHSSSENTLTNVTANSNNQYGIYLYNASYNFISNSTLNLNSYGLYLLYYSNFNNISDNKLFNNTKNGITTSNCDPTASCPGGNTNNTFYRNKISNNSIGIYSQNSSSTINSNLVCENVNLDFNSTNWQSSSGDDNTCNRPDGWNDTGALGCTYQCPCYCSSCSGCQEKLNDSSCNAVYLTSNITNFASTCINNPGNFNNKTFDCQGHTIDGNGTNYGIYLNGTFKNTIKNCIITEFYYGVYLFNSSNNTLMNNTVNSNNYTGIFLSYSLSNTFSGITANNNKQYGFYADASSTGNAVNSNTFCYNNGTVNSSDIYDADSNSGDINVCETFYNWRDESSFLGCKQTCNGLIRYRLPLQIGWNLISLPMEFVS